MVRNIVPDSGLWHSLTHLPPFLLAAVGAVDLLRGDLARPLRNLTPLVLLLLFRLYHRFRRRRRRRRRRPPPSVRPGPCPYSSLSRTLCDPVCLPASSLWHVLYSRLELGRLNEGEAWLAPVPGGFRRLLEQRDGGQEEGQNGEEVPLLVRLLSNSPHHTTPLRSASSFSLFLLFRAVLRSLVVRSLARLLIAASLSQEPPADLSSPVCEGRNTERAEMAVGSVPLVRLGCQAGLPDLAAASGRASRATLCPNGPERRPRQARTLFFLSLSLSSRKRGERTGRGVRADPDDTPVELRVWTSRR